MFYGIKVLKDAEDISSCYSADVDPKTLALNETLEEQLLVSRKIK